MIHFEELLKELGPLIEVEGLEPDEHESCLLVYDDELQVQLECEQPAGDRLIIGSALGEVPPGRYREDLLVAALVANGRPYPRYGTLAFSDQNDNLILFEKLPEQGLNADFLAKFLTKFNKQARAWREALQGGSIPTDFAV